MDAALDTEQHRGVAPFVSDIVTMTKRELYRYLRVPALLSTATALPIMWVLLFNYVFGGAIPVPAPRYVDYLVPGVMVLTAVWGMSNTALGLAADISHGANDRFRSLPIARVSLFAGRTISDALRSLVAVGLVLATGFAVGFRVHSGVLPVLAAVTIAVAMGFAFSWVGALIGLTAKNGEAAQTGGLLVAIPLVFLCSIFVPTRTMPGWLQVVTELNPLTHAVGAARALILGGPVARQAVESFAWIGGILLVFVPLCVHRYVRASQG
jgi:ABC transporter DrrB family efflux protein